MRARFNFCWFEEKNRRAGRLSLKNRTFEEKAALAGKWETGALEVGLSVITHEPKIKSPYNELARAFKWSCSVIFFARHGYRRRVGGMDNSGVWRTLSWRDLQYPRDVRGCDRSYKALFDRADVIVLCAAYWGLEGTVAEGVNNHAVFAVFLEDRTGLHARYLVISARFGAGSMSPKMPAC